MVVLAKVPALRAGAFPIFVYPALSLFYPTLSLFYLPYPVPIPTLPRSYIFLFNLPCRTENGRLRDVREKEAITRKP